MMTHGVDIVELIRQLLSVTNWLFPIERPLDVNRKTILYSAADDNLTRT